MRQLLLLLLLASPAWATDYWIAASGGSDSNNGMSSGAPMATFAHAWTHIAAGDTLNVMDGTYTQQVCPTTSGTSGSRITIQAVNDGAAVIDGENTRVGPLTIGGRACSNDYQAISYVTVKGLVVKNSEDNGDGADAVIWITGSHNIFQRVSAYNADTDANSSVVWLSGSDNLFEDGVVAGSGRKMFLIWGDGPSLRNIVRRTFMAWMEFHGTNFNPGSWPWGDTIDLYGASSNIVENSIVYGMAPGPASGYSVQHQGGSADDNAFLGDMAVRIGKKWNGDEMTWPDPDPYRSPAPSRMTLTDVRSGFSCYGVGTDDNLFQDVFAYGNAGYGMQCLTTGTNQIVRGTFIGNDTGGNDLEFSSGSLDRFDSITDSYIAGTAYQGSGARLIYRYESTFSGNTPVPTLTSTPLWPWPMESRIASELWTHLPNYRTTNPAMENFSVTTTMQGIFDTLGAQNPNPTSGPLIHDITDPGTVARYEKFEVSFSVDTVATNLQFPWDAAPPSGIDTTTYPLYAGVSVDGLFSADNWSTTITVPAFYAAGYTEATKGGFDWYYPSGTNGWKVRFAPTSTGNWKYKLRVTDSEGTMTTTEDTFTVTTGTSKGFLGVSATDSRYFQFSDGTVFNPFGTTPTFSLDDPEVTTQPLLTAMGTAGTNFARYWFMPYGSAWIDWTMSNGEYDGYVPRAGLEPKSDGTNTYLASVVQQGDGTGWYAACRAFSPTRTPAVKQSTNYRFSITYMASSIAGPRGSGSYGVVGGYDTSTNYYCQDSGQGTVVTTYGANQATQTTISGTWASSTADYAPYFWVSMRNATAGKAWITDISLQEDLGGGTFGPNLFNDGSQQYETYFPERAMFAMDKLVTGAESAGVYLKVVLDEKNDAVWLKLDDDGTWVIGGESDNADGVYGAGRASNKTRWLQQAWWRYVQARWGYSTAIHSWEFLNEGDPDAAAHLAAADQMGKYMRCGAFGEAFDADAADECTYTHPNRHMVTTSFWSGWPSNFWGHANFPNLDYADVHAYIYTGPGTESQKLVMEDDSSYQHTFSAATYAALAPGMPIVRGETGMDTFAAQVQQADIQTDTTGSWYHNWVWAQIGGNVMSDIYWWTDGATGDIMNGTYDHRSMAGTVGRFLAGLPLANGNYVDSGATGTSGLRIVGQKDATNNKAHLWVQCQTHTWRNVVDSVPCTPITGSVTLAGMTASKTYRVRTWNTATGAVASTTNISANGSGVVSIPITALATDTAFLLDDLLGSTGIGGAVRMTGRAQ